MNYLPNDRTRCEENKLHSGSILCNYINSVILDRIDRRDQLSLLLRIEQTQETDGLIEGRLAQIGHIFHIAILLYEGDDLVDKGNLLLIQ